MGTVNNGRSCEAYLLGLGLRGLGVMETISLAFPARNKGSSCRYLVTYSYVKRLWTSRPLRLRPISRPRTSKYGELFYDRASSCVHSGPLIFDEEGPQNDISGAVSKQIYDEKKAIASLCHELPRSCCCRAYNRQSESDASRTSESAFVLPPSRQLNGQSSPKSSSWTLSTTSDARAEDPRTLSTVRLCLAHIGAAMTLFLATTDSTVVSTSLPTIASDLRASHSQYTWVGVAYLLTQTACQPLYGRISDLVGRRCILYCSILIFALGSLLCGIAQNITWLIASRGVAGIGGGGIVSAVWVITAEIVPEQDRAKWSQALSVTWSCSAVAGPLLGGLFSSRSSSIVNWRWIFYLNLPVCFAAFLVFEFSLRRVRLGSSEQASWKALRETFDFVGLVLFVGGTGAIILGLSFGSSNGWKALSTLILIISGGIQLGAGAIYEIYTKREALFPSAAFKNRSAVIILIITFLHQFAFNAGTYYLALYFQAVNGATPVGAGLLLLPYSLGSSLISMPAAWFIGYKQSKSHNTSGQKWVICLGLAISTLGFGLLCLLHGSSPRLLQIVCPLVAGLGIGMLFHAPHQVFTRALQSKDLASGTSAFFLVRFTGATAGLAVAGAIFDIRLSHLLPQDSAMQTLGSSFDLHRLSSLQSTPEKIVVLHAVSLSIKSIWIVCAPCLGIAMMMAFFLRNMPMLKVKSSRHVSREKYSATVPPVLSMRQSNEAAA